MAYKQSGTEGGRGAAIVDMGALTAAPSAAAPTKTEFDKVVADAVVMRAKLNELLGNLRDTNLVD